MERIQKKAALPVLCILIIILAYINSAKRSETQADDLRKFVDEVNLREEQLNEELQPLIERNRKINETAGLSEERSSK